MKPNIFASPPPLPIVGEAAVQLAHALDLMNRLSRTLERGNDAGGLDHRAIQRTLPVLRRLVADAHHAICATIGVGTLSPGLGAFIADPLALTADLPAPEIDTALETIFVEYDTAKAAWQALPREVEDQHPSAEVDRYFAAEEELLALSDARPVVLARHADLLVEMYDEIADQMGPALANAIANVAQAQRLRLEEEAAKHESGRG